MAGTGTVPGTDHHSGMSLALALTLALALALMLASAVAQALDLELARTNTRTCHITTSSCFSATAQHRVLPRLLAMPHLPPQQGSGPGVTHLGHKLQGFHLSCFL